MASLTALLVVLTLTGEPIANALCEIWCGTSSETMKCGEEAVAQPRVSKRVVAETECAALLTAIPFLREEARAADRSGVISTVPASLALPAETRLLLVQLRRATTDGCPAPPIVLRR
jgi:hypothetical protein